MKKGFVLINIIMSMVILFSILFQSVDNYEHLAKKLTEKKCHHPSDNSNQITHQHLVLEDCFVCDFAFSTYVTSSLSVLNSIKNLVFYKTQIFFVKITSYFYNGISYSLRGPPSL
jgi:hypothetical protein